MKVIEVEVVDDELLRMADAWRRKTADDYLEEIDHCFDCHFVMDSAGCYRGVQLCRCCGGPAIWFDTSLRLVVIYFGGEIATCSLPSSVVRAIDELYEPAFDGFLS